MPYKQWINEMDVKIDYYSAYIKAWIAFNSYYRTSTQYKDFKNDGDIISLIANPDNNDILFLHLKSLVNGSGSVEIEFQSHIGNLGVYLDQTVISTNCRKGYQLPINFRTAPLINPKTGTDNPIEYNRAKYSFISFKENRRRLYKSLITDLSDNVIYEFVQENYMPFEFKQHINKSNSKKLPKSRKRKMIEIYESCAPYLAINLYSVDQSKAKRFGNLYLIDETDLIASSLIEMLYGLRCALIHGHVTPNPSVHKVYEFAYKILSDTLNRLVGKK